MSRPARFKDLTEMKAAISITDNTKEMSTKAVPSFRITIEWYDVKLTLHLFKSHLKCHNGLGLTLHYGFWITIPPHPPKRELGARVPPAPNNLDMVNTDPTGQRVGTCLPLFYSGSAPKQRDLIPCPWSDTNNGKEPSQSDKLNLLLGKKKKNHGHCLIILSANHFNLVFSC